MTNSQTLCRVQAPALRHPHLYREDLVRMLSDAIESSDSPQNTSHKLILLCTPAGYGKTMLLFDTIKSLSLPCCWYFLENTDTPAIFLEMLISSIRLHFPNFGMHLDMLLTDMASKAGKQIYGQEDWNHIIDAIIDALDHEISQHFVLAFCDYHTVNSNETITRLMNRLLAYCPQQGTLVIESRVLPNLTLAPLVARRQMFGLGSNRLRFTAQELYELAHLQGFTNFTLQEAEYHVDVFEGWIVGILLNSGLGYTQMYPLVPSPNEKGVMQEWLTGRQQLSIYVVEEIFSQETEAYSFLKDVCILDQLTPTHCNILLDITDATERLRYVEQQGLFVSRGEKIGTQDEDIYIFHSILRDLFREELRTQSPKRYQMLHQRLAHYMSEKRDYTHAFKHALLAQEYGLALNLLKYVSPMLIEQDDTLSITEWIDKFPVHISHDNPWLLLMRANLYLMQNEYVMVPSLLDTISALLSNPTLEEDVTTYLLLQVELKLAYSKLLFYQGEFQSAQELCQQVLDMLPADEGHLRIRAHRRLGVCLIVGSGRIHEGISQLQQALQLSGSQKKEMQTAMLHRSLASAYSWLGNYVLADYHQTRALHVWEKLNESQGIINSLISMGLLKLRQGDIQKAEEELTHALQLARQVYKFKSGEAYALISLGELYCSQTNYTQALVYLEDGLHLARQCGDQYLTHCGLCSLAISYLFTGDIQTCQFFLSQVVLKEQEENSFESLLYYLTQSMVLLAQQAYHDAQQVLESVVITATYTNVRFLHVHALLLLTICHYRQQQLDEAQHALEKALKLNEKGNFDFVFTIESRRYHELSVLLQQARQDNYVQIVTPIEPELQPIVVTHDTLQQNRYSGNSLRIQSFGEPQVFIEEIPVTHWHMTRALELFFLLLESSSPLQKEQIILALWPNVMSDQIDTTARTAIYYVRKAIGKACIISRSGLYSLDLTTIYGEVQYDVTQFEDHYNRAKVALDSNDVHTAQQSFSHVVDLYKGDYLQPFYNDWCIPRRDQLRQRYMDAHQQLALLAWRRDCWDESLHYWRHLLALDPCFEKAHYGIMRCLLKQGKRELALRQYQRCCQCLADELHTVPGHSTQKLYQRMIQIDTIET